MTRVTPYQTGFEVDDSKLSPGTIFRKLDGSLWETLPNGDQQALGGGGSQPLITIVHPIPYNTPSLNAGVVVPGWVPKAGDQILALSFSVPTGFDGTTPKADVFLGSTAAGLGASISAPFFVDTDSQNQPGAYGAANIDFMLTAVEAFKGGYGPVLEDADALYVAVSQDGTKGGAATGSTVGLIVLYMYVLPISGAA